MCHPSVILATASYDRTIRFWEAQTGRCYRTILYAALPKNELAEGRGKPRHVNRLEISPDKRYLAAACNPYIRLFDLNFSNLHVRTFASHTSNVMALEFQRDGRVMYSGSEDGTVKTWDMRAPNFVREYEANCCINDYENDCAVNSIVLHPNQNELITGDQNGAISVWDLRADSWRLELIPEGAIPVRSLSVMSDGTMLVAANDRGTCYVWSMLRGNQMMTEFEPLHKLQAHDEPILKCLLAPEKKYLATASSDKTVKIWNVDNFKLEKVLTGHQRWVWDCAFSADAEFLVTASSDMTARLWSMKTGKDVRVFQGHHKATVCCALRDF
ncbi:protein LST8 homolog [Eutrema salsugineum]|uniref:protein LST8 homolog n=1 Tax=Eutrema salsugineum TaxID=72664 RepID=UPI000CED2429|nr:protein LST8 homolog [Eutrema salsugineum]